MRVSRLNVVNPIAASPARAAGGKGPTALVRGAVLTQFHIDTAAVVEATLLFWVIHMIVQLIALRVLVHEPSVALADMIGRRIVRKRRAERREAETVRWDGRRSLVAEGDSS